jgi:glycosyltransferase involved in cell wall biosynthesis
MAGGGAERVALAGIIDLLERGHEVDLVLVRAEGALLPLIPPQVQVFDLRAPRIVASLLPLARYLRKRKPDAVHALMWPVTIVAILAHRLARSRARLLVSDHVAHSKMIQSPRERALFRWTTRWLYPAADFRIVVSADAADDLATFSGIPRDRFEVIYNPISPPAAIATNPQVERLWGDCDQRIITVGALKEQKNHALLLRAFAQINSFPKSKLMILGEGQLRPKLEGLARELGIADRVLMPGFAIDPWPYLASADLFVLSSDYEGFGIALVEAMYAGLRVVSTDCRSGPREILDGGRYGKLVPTGDSAALADAIDQALAEPAQPDRMREQAEVMTGPSKLARYAALLLG